MSSTITITDNEFETEVLKATQPVLAYFWDEWCGPCRLVSPSVDWVASHYSDRLKVVKIQVDPNPESVKFCKIEGVPGLRLFENGQAIASHEGAITKQKLVEMIEDCI